MLQIDWVLRKGKDGRLDYNLKRKRGDNPKRYDTLAGDGHCGQ